MGLKTILSGSDFSNTGVQNVKAPASHKPRGSKEFQQQQTVGPRSARQFHASRVLKALSSGCWSWRSVTPWSRLAARLSFVFPGWLGIRSFKLIACKALAGGCDAHPYCPELQSVAWSTKELVRRGYLYPRIQSQSYLCRCLLLARFLLVSCIRCIPILVVGNNRSSMRRKVAYDIIKLALCLTTDVAWHLQAEHVASASKASI